MKLSLVVCSFAACSTLASQAALVAHWNFEEGAGSTTVDQTTSTTSGAIGTGVAWSTDTPGSASSASLSFPGTAAGHLRSNLSAATIGIDGSNAKTLVGWIKAGDTANVNRMFLGWSPTNGGTNGADLRLGLDGSGFLRFEVSGGFSLYNTVALDDNIWHMVGVVIDASDNVNSVQFYLDGSLVNPTSAGNRLINTTGTSADSLRNDIYLGLGNPGVAQEWAGLLDEVRIYNSALNLSELNAIRSAIAVPEPGTAILGFFSLLGLLRRRR